MRKNLRLLLTALLCAVIGQAMAQEVTLDFTSNDVWKFPEGSSNKGTTAANFTNGTYTITLQGETSGYYFNSQGYLIFGKTDATLTLPAFNFDVEKIVVTGKSGASTAVKQNIYVGEEAVSTETEGATGTNTYIIASAYQTAGKIYTLKVNSNHNSQVTKIEIYKKGTGGNSKLTPNLSFGNQTTFTVLEGSNFTPPELTNQGDGAVTYSSNEEKVATVNSTSGAVEIKGAGTAIITATSEETKTYEAGSASYTINVQAVTQGEIVDGVFDFTGTTDYGTGLRPTSDNSSESFITEDKTWTAGNVTLVSSGKYRWWLASAGNTLRFYSNLVDEVQTSKMTISVPSGKTITKIEITGGQQFTANVGEYSSGTWTGEAQSVEFTYAAQSGNVAVKTVSVTYGDSGDTPVEKQEPIMKFSKTYYTVVLGDDIDIPELTYNGDGDVTYSSNNEEAVTVDPVTGVVDIVGVGTAIITATAAETANFFGKSINYTINVINDQGTHEVIDGTFDFTDLTDYGTGLKPSNSDEYMTEDVTWTAGKVTLVSSGKYRWWLNGNGNTLRFYKADEGADPSKMTISVPNGYNITKITFTGEKNTYTANVGTYEGTTWTGNAQSVELTYGLASGTIQVKTITVEYGANNRIDPQLAWSAETASATLGSSFTAPTLSKAQNYNGVINYSSSNESVATISAAGAVTIVGAGTTIITATAPSSDTNIESTASYTLTVTDPNASDVTYDFTTTNDYGTGLEPSSDSSADSYIYDDKTWINNPVSLVTSGKYRYWLNAKGNTLRLYSNVVEEQETTKLTFSVPNDKTITAIEFNTGENDAFTTTVGTFSEKAWAGDAKEVVLTLAKDKKPYISTIKVTYKNASAAGIPGDADEDGSVSLADIMLVVDAILTDDTSHLNLTNADIDKSGKLSLSDIMGIVAIILAQ